MKSGKSANVLYGVKVERRKVKMKFNLDLRGYVNSSPMIRVEHLGHVCNMKERWFTFVIELDDTLHTTCPKLSTLIT